MSETDSWLRLLADERPGAELEDFRREQLAGASGARRDQLTLAADRAFAIRRRLDARQRHAAELTVLNDLARRLTTLRDSGGVLSEVAAQARRLLGVDVAYLMLRQDDGGLRIEVVDGSMGSVLRGIELAAGTGLGGRVVRTGEPMWSEDYLRDSRIEHLPSVDAAAGSEQLGGILGVPLIRGDQPIGVLLAADRRPRSFHGGEVELLAALASHAAVALHNAGLFEELSSANATLRRADELRERLTAAVIEGGGYPEIADELTRALGRPVAIFGADHEVLAGAPGSAEPVGEPRAVTRLDDAVLAPVVLGSGYAGCLIASGAAARDPDAPRLLGLGATSVAVVITSEQSRAEAELRTRGEFVSALLSPGADEAGLRRRARRAGIGVAGVRVVAVFDPGDADPRQASSLAGRVAAEFGGWSAEHSGHVVALLPGITAERAADRIRRFDLSCAVGIAPCSGGVHAIRTAHESARQTATVLLALGRTRDCARAAELGLYRSLFGQAGRDELLVFINDAVGPLLEHDRDRKRDLATTLRTYLEQSRHHARTCELLHIHPNTLYQRLERIDGLLGPGWREPERALEVQLALRLDDVLSALRARE
ncbi:GAF domain-containing protein [Amycolatopsis sp. YIM 10]|uniref:helix-turn-helix domain-containing protein n=1 Tax=Amycolatopsis sp. YIM 10 TaxID=2653857 RepID=UPI00129037E0|nr:GAF domain-containing protein [Amycolatopsis sp. YIM 10]QFU90399.1 Purine catabolism regulatory protein [Amycolatopsis sp. YIM 10]